MSAYQELPDISIQVSHYSFHHLPNQSGALCYHRLGGDGGRKGLWGLSPEHWRDLHGGKAAFDGRGTF